jgi:hypothetical protein
MLLNYGSDDKNAGDDTALLTRTVSVTNENYFTVDS